MAEDYYKTAGSLLVLEGTRQSILVEVKATTGDVVRMTIAQARTAVNEFERFALW